MVDAPTQTTPRTGTHYPAHTQAPKWIDNYIKVAVQDLEKLVIPKYADTTARDAAITSPVEGDMCWLQSTNALQVYETTWKQVYPAAIPNITGGSGAPSGGANGDIYFQY